MIDHIAGTGDPDRPAVVVNSVNRRALVRHRYKRATNIVGLKESPQQRRELAFGNQTGNNNPVEAHSLKKALNIDGVLTRATGQPITGRRPCCHESSRHPLETGPSPSHAFLLNLARTTTNRGYSCRLDSPFRTRCVTIVAITFCQCQDVAWRTSVARSALQEN